MIFLSHDNIFGPQSKNYKNKKELLELLSYDTSRVAVAQQKIHFPSTNKITTVFYQDFYQDHFYQDYYQKLLPFSGHRIRLGNRRPGFEPHQRKRFLGKSKQCCFVYIIDLICIVCVFTWEILNTIIIPNVNITTGLPDGNTKIQILVYLGGA
jgi:hypothetical protein